MVQIQNMTIVAMAIDDIKWLLSGGRPDASRRS